MPEISGCQELWGVGVAEEDRHSGGLWDDGAVVS